MELRELNPFTNNYAFPVTKYSPCILREEYLGIVNLPLISKLNMCDQLLVSVDREIEAVGPDGTSVLLKPLGEPLYHNRLLAKTPLTPPTRTSTWIPPRLSNEQVLAYARHMNILVGGDEWLQLNILPHPIEELILDEELIRAKEGGSVLRENIVGEEIVNIDNLSEPKLSGNNIRYSYKNFDIVLKTTSSIKAKKTRHRVHEGVYIYSEDMQLISLNNILYISASKVIIDHAYYNVKTRYLQPLGFAEETINRATVTSPAICLESVSQESICLVSEKPITLDFHPGKILLAPRGPLYILFSKKMFEWNKSLSILWSLVNRPVKIRASLKTILWRIIPYSVKPLYFEANPTSKRKITIRLALWNSTDKLVQAETWFPGKIVSAKTLDYGLSEVEELIPDYDRVRVSIPSIGVVILELELLRLPSLLLKELMGRSILSPYTSL